MSWVIKAEQDQNRKSTFVLWQKAHPEDEVGQKAVAYFFNVGDHANNPFAMAEGFWKLRWTDKRRGGPDDAWAEFSRLLFDQEFSVADALESDNIEYLHEMVGVPAKKIFDEANKEAYHERD